LSGENWQLFADPRFQLRFKYPATTAQGHVVESIEEQSSDFTRVHLVSRDSEEVYFEVRRYHNLLSQDEYQRHRAYLEKRFELDGFTITELTDHTVGMSPAYLYSFQWDGKQRVAILIRQAQVTYRIIYDPHSPVNTQILSTIELIT
jgi:hypothetical protein